MSKMEAQKADKVAKEKEEKKLFDDERRDKATYRTYLTLFRKMGSCCRILTLFLLIFLGNLGSFVYNILLAIWIENSRGWSNGTYYILMLIIVILMFFLSLQQYYS